MVFGMCKDDQLFPAKFWTNCIWSRQMSSCQSDKSHSDNVERKSDIAFMEVALLAQKLSRYLVNHLASKSSPTLKFSGCDRDNHCHIHRSVMYLYRRTSQFAPNI